MTELKITQEIFEKHCSSATNSNDSVFNAVEYGFSLSANRVANQLGLDVLAEIPPKILEHVERAVCLDAYADAIPHLDLVLTPTGFGVVSTSNVVPASADRVAKLHKQVSNALDDTLDDIISLLRFEEQWNCTDMAYSLFTSVLWSARQLRRCGFPLAHRSDLIALGPEISIAENGLREYIGDEVMDKLVAAIRTATLSSKQTMLLQLIERFIIAHAKGAAATDTTVLRNVVARYLIANITDFPEFSASSAYEALNIKTYENSKEDSCFFFG